MLVIAGDGWGGESVRKGSWTTESVVLYQHTRTGTQNRGPSEDSLAAFLRTFQCHQFSVG